MAAYNTSSAAGGPPADKKRLRQTYLVGQLSSTKGEQLSMREKYSALECLAGILSQVKDVGFAVEF